MCQCVKNFHLATECSIEAALEAASLHPARFLDVQDRKGTLEFGSDADFIFLDDDLNVMATFVAGRNVYKSPNISPDPMQFNRVESCWNSFLLQQFNEIHNVCICLELLNLLCQVG